MRADVITRSYPCAPVYVCLDAALQEQPLEREPRLPDLTRHRPPSPPAGDAMAVSAAASILAAARRPLLLIGRVGRDQADWDARVELAERLGATVLTDLKVAAAFPSEHRLHPVAPATFLPAAAAALLRDCDAVLALDWVDLAGTLRSAFGEEPPPARIVSVTCDAALHNGWSKDHFALAATDLAIAAHPDPFVAELLEALPAGLPAERAGWPPTQPPAPAPPDAGEQITVSELAHRAPRGAGGHRALPRARAARLVRRGLAASGPARLPGPGRRGGPRLRAGHGRRRGAGARGIGPRRGRGARRRRLPDGRHGAVDRGPLPATAARRGRQQPQPSSTTRSTRSASPARAAGRSRTAGSASRSATPTPTSPHSLARSACAGSDRSTNAAALTGELEQALAAVRAGEAAVVDVHVLESDYTGASTTEEQG